MTNQAELYHKAIEVIENNPKWASGKSIDIVSEEDNKTFNGRPARIWLKNEMGQIIFTLFLEGQTLADNKHYPIKLAHHKPVDGWVTVTTEEQYRQWRFATVKAIGRL